MDVRRYFVAFEFVFCLGIDARQFCGLDVANSDLFQHWIGSLSLGSESRCRLRGQSSSTKGYCLAAASFREQTFIIRLAAVVASCCCDDLLDVWGNRIFRTRMVLIEDTTALWLYTIAFPSILLNSLPNLPFSRNSPVLFFHLTCGLVVDPYHLIFFSYSFLTSYCSLLHMCTYRITNMNIISYLSIDHSLASFTQKRLWRTAINLFIQIITFQERRKLNAWIKLFCYF